MSVCFLRPFGRGVARRGRRLLLVPLYQIDHHGDASNDGGSDCQAAAAADTSVFFVIARFLSCSDRHGGGRGQGRRPTGLTYLVFAAAALSATRRSFLSSAVRYSSRRC